MQGSTTVFASSQDGSVLKIAKGEEVKAAAGTLTGSVTLGERAEIRSFQKAANTAVSALNQDQTVLQRRTATSRSARPTCRSPGKRPPGGSRHQ